MTEQRLSFMEFESPWLFNPGTVRLPSPPEGLSTDEVRQRLMEGQLAQPYILETSSERCLYFTQANLQSVMSLDEPDALICCVYAQDDGVSAVQPCSETHHDGRPRRRLAGEILLSQPARSSDHRGGNRPASGRSAGRVPHPR